MQKSLRQPKPGGVGKWLAVPGGQDHGCVGHDHGEGEATEHSVAGDVV